ncbi:hypothetical protein [Mesorhizobium sp. SP-1A]|uniref:hypothetical protein n=1 Tax=Mesorhizobium sp. SP-1A TaxID=3077840 RepID=UPI0028F7328D|nr:hypothetical protein [Mesorhizobium sp. SP-1A]
MTPSAESMRLSRIRSRLVAIAPGDWSLVADGSDSFVEARGPMGELLPIARFAPGATADEIATICDAPADLRFLVGLVDRAIARIKPPAQSARPPQREPKDYAAECAMKCAEPAFRVFLEQQHGLGRPLTDERVAQKVRGLLGVTSRAELNDGGAAVDRWMGLRSEYDAWRRAGR